MHEVVFFKFPPHYVVAITFHTNSLFLSFCPRWFSIIIFSSTDAKIYLLLGQQRVAKFNERQRQLESASTEDTRNLIQIMMVVVRLPRQETDIVISYNVPLQIAAASSSREVAHEGDIQEAEVWFRNLIGSFQVRDWSLFGN